MVTEGLLLLGTGLLVGLISSFFGIGGGLLVVPILYGIYPQIPASVVIFCSLAMICCNSAVNSFNFYRAGKRFAPDMVAILGLAMTIGLVLSGMLLPYISRPALKVIFACLLLLVAAKQARQLLRSPSKPQGQTENNNATLASSQANEPPRPKKRAWASLLASGFAGGMVSGLTGLGGGIVLVPLLVSVVGISFLEVSAYSNAVMFVGTLGGLLIQTLGQPANQVWWPDGSFPAFQLGPINTAISGLLFLGATLTSRYGVRLNHRFSQRTITLLFIALMITFAIRVLVQATLS